MKSVQSADVDAVFIRNTYKKLKGKYPATLKEDFCGTFLLCYEWVKLNKAHQAVGVDLDSEPINYGKAHHYQLLSDEQKKRVHIIQENVLSPAKHKTDVVVALNFSYYIFKQREVLKKYFATCLSKLNKDGVLLIDCFGGTKSFEPLVEETKHRDFIYYWDEDYFDPISFDAKFYIHFKRNGEKKREKVFTYDWRLWNIPELRDLLHEVGFKKTTVFWEGTTKKGTGNGVFKPSKVGEICESWIAYITAEK